MIDIEPINQKTLFGLDKYILHFINLYEKNKFPNKILLSGLKGIGKSTLAYHFINYVLSKDEKTYYDKTNFRINENSKTFKTIKNKSNQNFILIDVKSDKKFIEIGQIRDLISNLNKSTFNAKPKFILIDNIEFLNLNSINAILKILEEPSSNIYFILINNNKNILPTLSSRCINYKISISNAECLNISENIFNEKLENFINKDILNYYFTPGNIYDLINYTQNNEYNLKDTKLKQFLKLIINDKLYKKNPSIKLILNNLIEFYFRKINHTISSNIYNKYSYFLKRISDTRRFNLDEETLFMEFEKEILNG